MTTNNPNATTTTTPTTATGDNAGHMAAWRAQKARGDFATGLTVALTTGVNPWRVNCPGWHFYNAVLAKLPKDATVATVMAMAKEAGIKGAMSHLIWLYPWVGKPNRLVLGGVQYPEQPKAETPKAAPKAEPTKAAPKAAKAKSAKAA